ncbi:hypothetical protein [Paenibacillus tundrae]
MTNQEQFLWEQLRHENEVKAELTRMLMDSLTFIAKTEQQEAFQLHQQQRAETREKQLAELDC